jgi:hypothetical protein
MKSTGFRQIQEEDSFSLTVIRDFTSIVVRQMILTSPAGGNPIR